MPIYLDHNATTPLNPEVAEAMMPYMSGIYGNPSSVHRFGRLTRDALEQARVQVGQCVGAEPNQVVFTSGGTEANNLAIKGSLSNQPLARFAVSPIEHACMVEPAKAMAKLGWELDELVVDDQGRVATDHLQSAVTTATRFVSVMAANNETGVVQDLASLVEVAKSVNPDVLFHSDACQMVGKLPISFKQLNLDLMSVSSHKLYGPQGAGALIVSRSIDLQPQILGGGQEKGLRSGTENLAAIVGFGRAAELATETQQARKEHVLKLQQQLVDSLIEQPDVTIFSAQAERLPNTVQFSVQGIDGETLLMQLDRKGFAVSSGSACDSGRTEPSHVLMAMGVDKITAKGAIRVSFGEQNTREQVVQFIDVLAQIRQQLN
jgi:cysteine desulfurase